MKQPMDFKGIAGIARYVMVGAHGAVTVIDVTDDEYPIIELDRFALPCKTLSIKVKRRPRIPGMRSANRGRRFDSKYNNSFDLKLFICASQQASDAASAGENQ